MQMLEIETLWWEQLKEEYSKPYFAKLKKFVEEEYKQHKCYPDRDEIFKAFELTPFEKVKVVIIGQD